MGASGWQHFIPHDVDISAALRSLQQQEFAAGRYTLGILAKLRGPKTIERVRALAGEGGTHSVLDIHRIRDSPVPLGVAYWAERLRQQGILPDDGMLATYAEMEAASRGSLGPADPNLELEVFGARPRTRKLVASRSLVLMSALPRETAIWLTITNEAGTPTEIFIVGKSGD